MVVPYGNMSAKRLKAHANANFFLPPSASNSQCFTAGTISGRLFGLRCGEGVFVQSRAVSERGNNVWGLLSV
jgi:hypothetical protein